RALRTPAFWVFTLATSLYGLIAAGLSLFNQSILAERGFERDVFLTVTALAPLVGLASNLGTGWLATRLSFGRLLAGAMLLLAGCQKRTGSYVPLFQQLAAASAVLAVAAWWVPLPKRAEEGAIRPSPVFEGR